MIRKVTCETCSQAVWPILGVLCPLCRGTVSKLATIHKEDSVQESFAAYGKNEVDKVPNNSSTEIDVAQIDAVIEAEKQQRAMRRELIYRAMPDNELLDLARRSDISGEVAEEVASVIKVRGLSYMLVRSGESQKELNRNGNREPSKKPCSALRIASWFSLFIAGASMVGLLVSVVSGSTKFLTLVLSLATTAIFLALTIMLLKSSNRARLLFLILAPLGELAAAYTLKEHLWRNDIPYSALAVVVYVPLSLMLSRGKTLKCVGLFDVDWFSRGGPLLVASSVFVFIGHFGLMTLVSPPQPISARGGIFMLHDAAEYADKVARIQAVRDILLAHYMAAFFLVSMPTRYQRKN